MSQVKWTDINSCNWKEWLVTHFVAFVYNFYTASCRTVALYHMAYAIRQRAFIQMVRSSYAVRERRFLSSSSQMPEQKAYLKHRYVCPISHVTAKQNHQSVTEVCEFSARIRQTRCLRRLPTFLFHFYLVLLLHEDCKLYNSVLCHSPYLRPSLSFPIGRALTFSIRPVVQYWYASPLRPYSFLFLYFYLPSFLFCYRIV
jgi:hypothetical protein